MVRAHDAFMRVHDTERPFERLCDKLKPLERTAYRGISRDPLTPLPSLDPEVLRQFEESGCDVKTEQAARRRFLEALGDNIPEDDFDYDLLPDYDAAQEVFSLLESPNEYEIIQVAREPFAADGNCLGFDVGYWGGDHYSIVCDSAVHPVWHPPDPECIDDLARELQVLNESFLFSSAESAASFRSWYRTQHWAETEGYPDQFCIIRVDRPRS